MGGERCTMALWLYAAHFGLSGGPLRGSWRAATRLWRAATRRVAGRYAALAGGPLRGRSGGPKPRRGFDEVPRSGPPATSRVAARQSRVAAGHKPFSSRPRAA